MTAGSAGNHAQSLAFAAKYFGVPCEIFVPVGAPDLQDRGVPQPRGDRDRGGIVGRRGDRRRQGAGRARRQGLLPPLRRPAVVAGQGTLGLELVEDLDDLSCVVVPLGGGGLASGVAIAVKSLMPHVRVVGVQAAVCSPFAGGTVATGAVDDARRRDRRQAPGALTRRSSRLGRRHRHGRRGRHRRRHGAAHGPGQALRRGCRRRRRGRPAGPAPCGRSAAATVRGALGRQRRSRRRARSDPSPRDDRRAPPGRVHQDRRPSRRPRQVALRVRRPTAPT